MRRRVILLLLLLAVLLPLTPSVSMAQAPSADSQVAAALLAGPGNQRAAAAVFGYDDSGRLVSLREGRNELVCLADDPASDGFSAACYHESLEPYMARGRELASQGMTDAQERLETRWREADEGSLAMPEYPATLYVLTGSSYDPQTGEVADSYLRYVVYMPWATIESTGLPEAPMGPGGPWLMYPGTAGAHVMISPPMPGSGR